MAVALGVAAALTVAGIAQAGDGSFPDSAAATFATGDSPEPIAVGDFNNDGNEDVVAGNFLSHDLTVRLGDGTGALPTQATGSPVAVGGAPSSIAVGDFNQDGNEDLAIANAFTNLTIRLGDGAGGFATEPAGSPYTAGTGAASVALGDFNGDGKVDLAYAAFYSHHVYVRLGNGAGGFPTESNDPISVSNPSSVAIGDFNDDGKEDLAIASLGSSNVMLKFGDGAGGFGGPLAGPTFATGTQPLSLAVGDFNGDANDDVAVASSADDKMTVRLGDGSGSLATEAPGSPFAIEHTVLEISVGDFNADGNQDLAIPAGTNKTMVRLGDGTGAFTTQPAGSPYAGGSYQAAVGDFDADGVQDLAITDPTNDAITIRRGAGPSPEAGNLVVNGNAEADGANAVRNPSGRVDVPGWTQFGHTATYVRYSAFGGFPRRLDSARWGGGEDLFTGGPSANTGEGLRQGIDVSSSAAAIDDGRANIRFSADLGGFRTDGDHMELSAVFLDGAGSFLGAPVALTPVLPADRHNRTVFIHRSATAQVPVGTRLVGVIMTTVHVNGAYADAYADNVRLFLDVTPDSTAPETKITKEPDNRIDKSKVKYKFSSSEPGSTFKCGFDSQHLKSCDSPQTYKHLDAGKHKFIVAATDAAGNTDPTPAKDKFKVEDG
jgi:FG-GAP-like repeat